MAVDPTGHRKEKRDDTKSSLKGRPVFHRRRRKEKILQIMKALTVAFIAIAFLSASYLIGRYFFDTCKLRSKSFHINPISKVKCYGRYSSPDMVFSWTKNDFRDLEACSLLYRSSVWFKRRLFSIHSAIDWRRLLRFGIEIYPPTPDSSREI